MRSGVAVLTAIALVTGTVVTGAGPHAGDEDAKRLDIAIETAARIHGIAVLTAIAAMVVLGLRLRRRPAERAELAEWVSAWIFVALLQGTIGYIQYFSDVPPLLVGIHVAGATILWATTVALVLRTRPMRRQEVELRAPPPGGRRRRADLIATAGAVRAAAVGPGAHRQSVRYSLSTQSGAIRPQPHEGENNYMQRSSLRRVGALTFGVSMVVMAAGTVGASSAPTEPAGSAPAGSAPTGSEPAHECGYAPSDITDGALAGFAGTTPAGELTPDFFARPVCGQPRSRGPQLRARGVRRRRRSRRWPRRSPAPTASTYVKQINDVTKDGTKCTASPSAWSSSRRAPTSTTTAPPDRSSSTATASRWKSATACTRMGDNNRIDPSLTQYIPVTGTAQYPEVTPVEGTREGDGILTIGTVAAPDRHRWRSSDHPSSPASTSRSRRSTRRAACSASDVVGIAGDSGDTTTDQANQTADRMLAQNVDAIIGAASSSVTLTIIDKIAGAGVTHVLAGQHVDRAVRPTRTRACTSAPPRRTSTRATCSASSWSNDGNQTVAIIRTQRQLRHQPRRCRGRDDYQLRRRGRVRHGIRDRRSSAFDGYADEIVAADPDAIIVIGFDESSLILRSLVEKGIGLDDKHVYGCDGNIGNALGVNFDAGN